MTFALFHPDGLWLRYLGTVDYYEGFTAVRYLKKSDEPNAYDMIFECSRKELRMHGVVFDVDFFFYSADFGEASFYIGKGYDFFFPGGRPDKFAPERASRPPLADLHERQLTFGETDYLQKFR